MRSVNVQARSDRASLVTALVSLTAVNRRPTTRHFLEGLSGDELRYIAAYLGARILDPTLNPVASRDLTAECIERFQRAAACRASHRNIEHKMIVLLEYLTMSELKTAPNAFAAGRGSA